MKFDDMIRQNLENVPIPEQLEPKNIAIMLKLKTTAEKDKNQSTVPAISVNTHQNKKVMLPIRWTAAIAAVVALGLGLTAIFSGLNNRLPVNPVGSGDIREAENYSDVYRTIQDSLINNGMVLGDDFETEKKPAVFPVESPGNAEKPPVKPADPPPPQGATSYKIPDSIRAGGADILKTDGTNIYYIANGALFMTSTDGGKLTLLSKNIHNNSSSAKYTQLFIDQNRLIAIGTVTAEVPFVDTPTSTDTTGSAVTSDTTTSGGSSTAAPEASPASETTTPPTSESTTAPVTTPETSPADGITTTTSTPLSPIASPATVVQTNTFVEVYDITDKATIPLIYNYKQNGSPLYAQMVDGSLYIATRYSGYQTKPLEDLKDLDNYVPAYYIGEEKHYIDAKSITLFAKSAGASYTVIAGLNPQSATPLTSVKAFLGGGKFVCQGAENLYIIGNDATIADGSFVVRFSLKNGVVSTNGGVAGVAQDVDCISEADGNLRLVTISTDKAGVQTANIFILGANLETIGQLQNIPIKKPGNIRFDGNLCYIFGAEPAVTTIDLSDKTAPKLVDIGSQGAYLYHFGDKSFSLSEEKLDDGKLGLKLTMFDGAKKELSSIKFAGNLTGTHRLYLDPERGIIGVPTMTSGEYGTKNLYILFEFTATGFVQKGILEYNDIDPAFEFNSGIAIGDVFYALSGGRIVSARLDDFKVIDTLPLQ